MLDPHAATPNPTLPARRRFCVLLAGLPLAGCASLDSSLFGTTHATRYRALEQADPVALLDRLTWGACERDLRALTAQGVSRFVAAQLAPASSDADGLLPAVAAQLATLRIATTPIEQVVFDTERQRKAADALADDADKQTARQAYQQELNRLAREAAARSLLLAVHSPQQLREQMTWFWLNHFNVHQYKHNLRAMLGDYEAGLRVRALGRFRDLVGFTASHPAMLRYLDNEQNAAGRINENYARELLELHTLGVDGGYTQRDVQELARVLTGHGVNLNDPADSEPPRVRKELVAQYRRVGLYEFNPNRHDYGDKQLLGVTVRGRGAAELDETLDLLARHPATARFITHKLAVYLVADTPPPALVDRLAQRFLASDGDIAAVLATLFQSAEFAASLRRGERGKFKDPQHYVVSAVRLLDDGQPVVNAGPVIGWLNRLGQGPYNRQTPDGYPLDESAWSSPGQLSTRFEVARAVGGGAAAALYRPEQQPAAQPAMMAKTPDAAAAAPPPPAALIARIAHGLYDAHLASQFSPATRQVLAQANTAPQFNALLLSAPEFMLR